MAAVISMLTGRDSDLQLEAARTLTNLAAGSDNHTMVVAKHAAPYLITFLSSSNTSLQVSPRLTRGIDIDPMLG